MNNAHALRVGANRGCPSTYIVAGALALGSCAFLLSRATAGPAPAPSTLEIENARVTQALEHALRRDISSPSGQLKLAVVPSARARDGWFSQVVIEGQPAQVKHLRLTELKLHANDIRIDVPYLLTVGKIRTLASNTSLFAVVTEDDVTRVLANGKLTASMGMKVKYIGNQIRVTGNWHWSWLNGPIVGVGRLQLVPGNKVDVDVLSLTLNGAEVPQFVKDKFMERLNPILDYTDVPFRPKFKTLKVIGPRAIITA